MLEFLRMEWWEPIGEPVSIPSVNVTFVGLPSLLCSNILAAFPFDVQFCAINFDTGYTLFDRLKIVPLFNKNSSFLVVSLLFDNRKLCKGTPEWEIEYHSDYIGESSYGLKVTYKMTRNGQFYFFLMILPTFVITTTCLTILLIPSKLSTGEKLSSI